MNFLFKIADLFFSMFDHYWRNSSSSFSSSSSFFDDHFHSRGSSFDDNDQTSSSMFEDTFRGNGVNPATGLPMINSSIDAGGNPIGFDNSHWSSFHDHWGSSSFNDSWSSSSFGSRWDD